MDAAVEGFVVFKTDEHVQEADTACDLPASVVVLDWQKMKESMCLTEDEFDYELQEGKRLERIDWAGEGWTMVYEEMIWTVEETEDEATHDDSD